MSESHLLRASESIRSFDCASDERDLGVVEDLQLAKALGQIARRFAGRLNQRRERYEAERGRGNEPGKPSRARRNPGSGVSSRAMLFSFAVAIAATAIADPGYAAARSSAEQVKNLGRFLESYLGDCTSDDPTFDKRACLSRADEVQKDHRGKLLRLEIEDASEQVKFAGWDAKRSAYLLHFTPFLSERGLGLSVGKPSGLNSDDGPIVKNMPVWVKAPNGEGDFGFRRSLERGNVRVELLFKPVKPWAMKSKKGEADVRGVNVELVGLRVTSNRGDQVLAEQVYR